MADYLFLIPALPLLAFAINFVLGRNIIRNQAHWIAAPAVLASFVLSVRNSSSHQGRCKGLAGAAGMRFICSTTRSAMARLFSNSS